MLDFGRGGWVVGMCLWLGFTTLAGAAEAPKDFALQDLNGKTFKLSEVLGKKVVVMNFWAAWCTTCKEEIPQLAELQKNTPDGEAVFLGLNAGDSPAKAKKFQDRNQYPYRVLLDQDKAVAKRYGVNGVPQTLIFGKGGKILFQGSRPPKELPVEK